jgi:hypothetical protein
MFADMAKGGFHLPTAHKESQDLVRRERQVSRQQGLRVEFTSDITDENKTNGNTG